jgi:hypothetical protein
VFGFSDRDATRALAVARVDVIACDSLPSYSAGAHVELAWSVGQGPASAEDSTRSALSPSSDSLDRLTYGDSPPGFHALRAAQPLSSGGCYAVYAYGEPGGAMTMFRVQSDRTLHQLSVKEMHAVARRNQMSN